MIEIRRALPFLAVALALFVAGCTLLPPQLRPQPDPDASIHPVGPPPGDTTAIDAAIARWQQAGINDYRLDIGFLCGCALAGNTVVDIEDGTPVRFVVNGTEVPGTVAIPFSLTVDGLLGEARRAVLDGGTVNAELDPATGAPTRLEIDYLPSAIDDELTIVVNSLTPAGIDRN